MIVVKDTTALVNWVEANRPDQSSNIPYFTPEKEGELFLVPDDPLILDGLKALGTEYTVVTTVHGLQVEIESKYLPQ